MIKGNIKNGGKIVSIVLYFAKININSHIQQVLKGVESKQNLLDKVYEKVNEKVQFTEEKLFKKDGDVFKHNVTYTFVNIDKLVQPYDHCIYGSIEKQSTLPIKQKNSTSGKIERKIIDYVETIDFFFDTYRECLVFYTVYRFKHKEFIEAFKKLLNKCTTSANEIFNFEVNLWRKGLKLEQIEEELKKLGAIQNLKITIIPPNPDDELLDDIIANAEGEVQRLKEGNLTEYVVDLKSLDVNGINLESGIVKSELNKLGNIHRKVSEMKATAREYVKVEANTRDGKNYSTRQSEPIKHTISNEQKEKKRFIEVCYQSIDLVINF